MAGITHSKSWISFGGRSFNTSLLVLRSINGEIRFFKLLSAWMKVWVSSSFSDNLFRFEVKN